MIWESQDGQIKVWIGKHNALTHVRVDVAESLVRGQTMMFDGMWHRAEVRDNLYQFSQQMVALVKTLFGNVRIQEAMLWPEPVQPVPEGTIIIDKHWDMVDRRVRYDLYGRMIVEESDVNWQDVTGVPKQLGPGG